jgi:hypothetical protein
VICVCELYNDGMQKRKDFFFSTSCFKKKISSFFSSKAAIKATHYMTTSSKTHKSHSPDAKFRTHVQGKQVYVGLHQLVQIL